MRAVDCGQNVIALRHPRKESEDKFMRRAEGIADGLDVVGRRLEKLRRLEAKTQAEIEALLKENPDYA